MLQILQYWRGKLQQKVLVKRNEVEGLHEYYAQCLKMKRQEKGYLQEDLGEDDDDGDVDRNKNIKYVNYEQDEFANISKSQSEKKKTAIDNIKYKQLFNQIKSQ